MFSGRGVLFPSSFGSGRVVARMRSVQGGDPWINRKAYKLAGVVAGLGAGAPGVFGVANADGDGRGTGCIHAAAGQKVIVNLLISTHANVQGKVQSTKNHVKIT